MEKELADFIQQEGLIFFGKISASISHELKNIMAIVSETSGFLEDLTQLAKKGKPLEFSMLENCCSSIEEEVQRGFSTIRQMNRFAHSVDTQYAAVDVAETAALAANLSGFLSVARPVDIEMPQQTVRVETNPFLLLSLMYRILETIFHLPEKKRIQISFQEEPEGVRIILQTDLHQTGQPDFDNKTQKTAMALDTQVLFMADSNQIQISVPVKNSDLENFATKVSAA